MTAPAPPALPVTPAAALKTSCGCSCATPGAKQASVSLQEPLETGADSGMLTLADVLPDLATMEEDCELRDAAAQLRQLVTALPEREQQILTLRYGLDGAVPQTQQQIAAQFGISRSYVSRLEKHALARLRRAWNQPHPL